MAKKSKALELSLYDIKNIGVYFLILFAPVLILVLEQLENGGQINWDVVITAVISIIWITFKKFISDYTKDNG